MAEKRKPNLLADTSRLTIWEQLEYRKHGICASEMRIIMEMSEYKTVLGLFLKKVERRPLQELKESVAERIANETHHLRPVPMFEGQELIIDPNTKYNLTIGLSDMVIPEIAKHFSTTYGFPVERKSGIYQHPDYPYLMANNVYIATTPDPETGELCRRSILQCRTLSHWKEDDVQDGPIWAHKLDACTEMCVMDADDAYLVYLTDNNPGGYFVHHIKRDFSLETEIIVHAKYFWCEHVENEILPIPVIPSSVACKEMASYALSENRYQLRPEILNDDMVKISSEYLALKERQKEIKTGLEELDDRLDYLKFRMSTNMLNQREAECGAIKMSWKVRPGKKCNYEGLKLAHPAIYAKFVSESQSPYLSVTIKKSAQQAKEAA